MAKLDGPVVDDLTEITAHEMAIGKQEAALDLGLCRRCNKHKATVVECESAMDFVHGNAKPVCRCCLLKEMQSRLSKLKDAISKEKEIIAKEGCR